MKVFVFNKFVIIIGFYCLLHVTNMHNNKSLTEECLNKYLSPSNKYYNTVLLPNKHFEKYFVINFKLMVQSGKLP